MFSQIINSRVFKRYRVLLVIFVLLTVFLFILRGSVVNRESQTEIRVHEWLENPTTGCDDHISGYGNEFAWLQNARVDKETKLFSIPCRDDKPPKYTFLYGREGTPLQAWWDNIETYQLSDIAKNKWTKKDGITIAVKRIEAHNLYHTMCEWYNVFLLSKLFSFNPKKVDILFMDDRPPGLLDETWDTLFGKVIRYPDLQQDVVFKNLIWNIIGYESPMDFHFLRALPYANDFYMYFMQSLGVQVPKSIDCNKLTVTVVWRRDYISHPERKTEMGGLIHRKFKNENEIMSVVKDVFKDHVIKEAVLETMNMQEQIELFTQTDILIGMHGAGMTHVMFLPSHAGVFEMFPSYWPFLPHFKASARWRGIKYLGWQNKDEENEFDNYYTRIPPEIVQAHALKLKKHVCHTPTHPITQSIGQQKEKL